MFVRRIAERLPAGLALPLLLILVFSVPVHAGAVSGISGNWYAKLTTEFHINGFGKRKYVSDGNCTITEIDDFSARLHCEAFNTSQGQVYSGGLNPVVRRKRLGWGLDGSSLVRIQANMTQFLVQKNLKKGQILDPANATYEFRTLDYKPVKLNKSSTKPGVATTTFTGKVVQNVNGKVIVKKFSCKVKIKFLARAP